jgi:hypothetical protein
MNKLSIAVILISGLTLISLQTQAITGSKQKPPRAELGHILSSVLVQGHTITGSKQKPPRAELGHILSSVLVQGHTITGSKQKPPINKEA